MPHELSISGSGRELSSCQPWLAPPPSPALSLAEIQATKDPAQLLTGQDDVSGVLLGLGPGEGASLQALGEEDEAAPVPEQDLDQISPPIAEGEEVTRGRVLTDRLLSEAGEPREGLPHVCNPDGQVDPDARRDAQHE